MSRTTIEDLPAEMLVKIFSYYIESEGSMAFSKNVVPVCKAWRSLSSTPSLWKIISIVNWNYAYSLAKRGLLDHTQSLATYGSPSDPILPFGALSSIRNLISLEISNFDILTNNIMKIIVKLCPNLECFRLNDVSSDAQGGPITPDGLDPILTACGPNLKCISITDCTIQNSKQVVGKIAAKCPQLEVLEWEVYESTVPIYKLANGCPRLQKLVLQYCGFDREDEDDCFGFKDLRVFNTYIDYFCTIDLSVLLKNSNNLEHLEFNWTQYLTVGDIWKIPSDKVQFLGMDCEEDGNFELNLLILKKAVKRWKETLVHLRISEWGCDMTSVLQILLELDSCPKLEVLNVSGNYVDQSFLKVFIERCKNLRVLQLDCAHYRNHEEIMRFGSYL